MLALSPAHSSRLPAASVGNWQPYYQVSVVLLYEPKIQPVLYYGKASRYNLSIRATVRLASTYCFVSKSEAVDVHSSSQRIWV
jgi:hypothetical protein